MRRLPVVPTALVALAVAAMIALGVWQLQRRTEKEAFIARVAANPGKPPVAFPRQPDDTLLLRRTTAMCLEPVTIDRAGAGTAGYRLIATCRDGADGPGIKVQLGTTHDPRGTTDWRGGAVSGWISHAPDARPLIASLVAPHAQEMLLVADRPAPGLAANTRPDVGLIPNNHLAYAGQWFLFAGIAVVIYALALRRRVRPQAAGRVTAL